MAQKRIVVIFSLLLGLLWYSYHLFRANKTSDGASFCLAERVVGAAQAAVHVAVLSHVASLAGKTRPFSKASSNETSSARIRRTHDFLYDLLQRPILPNPLSEREATDATVTHLLPSSSGQDASGIGANDLCVALAGKRVTMIGGQHVHFLHKYLLRSRELAEGRPHECPHREFCTHHHICLPPDPPTDSSDHSPQEDMPRFTKSPSAQLLIETASASIDYRMSDTLLAVQNESFWAYSLPYLDPITGIRLHESFWLAMARKAGIVVLGRAPLSPPGETYSGNWSFLDRLPNYIEELSTSKRIIGSRENSTRYERSLSTNLMTLKIVNAAIHATLARFLPDILNTLYSIGQVIRPGRRKRLLWTGAWFHFPGRGSASRALFYTLRGSRLGLSREWSFDFRDQFDVQLNLAMFHIAESKQQADLEDPWTLYYNLQVFLQNYALRMLLPEYGIVLLPLNAALSPYARMYGLSPQGPEEADNHRNEAIGTAFLSGLVHILQALH